MRRVTWVSSFGGVAGGAEQWLASVVAHCPQFRSRAVLLAAGPLQDELAALGVPTVVIPTGPRPRDIAATTRRLWTELHDHPADVVVANGVKAMIATAPAARARRLPLVWVKHDHSFDRLAPFLGRAATRVVATARQVGEPTRRRDLVVIEPPRVRDPVPRPEALADLRAYGWQPGAGPALVMIGRLVPYKGVDTAVEALALPGGEGWQLVAIGGGEREFPEEEARLTRLAVACGVADRLHLLGAVPDAGRLVRAFDALAVLTRPGVAGAPQAEGFGITALEAMVGGVPVVAVGPGPVADRLDTPTGAAGIPVPAADPGAVAAALGRLRDPAVRRRLGEAGERSAAGHPDQQQVADAVAAVVRAAAK